MYTPIITTSINIIISTVDDIPNTVFEGGVVLVVTIDGGATGTVAVGVGAHGCVLHVCVTVDDPEHC
jgi:hypothetical protein